MTNGLRGDCVAGSHVLLVALSLSVTVGHSSAHLTFQCVAQMKLDALKGDHVRVRQGC